MMNNYQNSRTLYRSRSGMILGVCKGLANHFDISVKVVRIIAVVLMLFTGFWLLVIAYLIAAYFMQPEPMLPSEPAYSPIPGPNSGPRRRHSYTTSRSMALSQLKNKFDSIDRRIQRMEGMVTDKEYNWEQRLREE